MNDGARKDMNTDPTSTRKQKEDKLVDETMALLREMQASANAVNARIRKQDDDKLVDETMALLREIQASANTVNARIRKQDDDKLVDETMALLREMQASWKKNPISECGLTYEMIKFWEQASGDDYYPCLREEVLRFYHTRPVDPSCTKGLGDMMAHDPPPSAM